uniref:THIF-type NAD/FAD binding fold domain-containing protein n=1 Tax=Guillardia theta TaxID=55529 RepID=A0A7S4PHG1_GUITH|mmetsp:Transcript_51127/g.159724  ORF Transcript_51127/g.159724 Transcript_51127/m.159724 type:complete len:373 (+) Transcript_51127:3-1121(+)
MTRSFIFSISLLAHCVAFNNNINFALHPKMIIQSCRMARNFRSNCCRTFFTTKKCIMKAVQTDGADADQSCSMEDFIDPAVERFSGIKRLYGSSSLERLRNAHVCVVGLGGVGSWVAESCARSGIGKITLVDLDEVCISNINRQLCALDSTVGRPKAEVLRARILDINPECNVSCVLQFLRRENALSILSGMDGDEGIEPQRTNCSFDFVVDAIDSVDDKAALISACTFLKVPIITSGGAGGLTDPTAIRSEELTKVEDDELLFHVRKKLRQFYGFPQGLPHRKRVKPWKIQAVYSSEKPIQTLVEEAASQGFRSCDFSMGTSAMVTGSFGLAMGSFIVKSIALGTNFPPNVQLANATGSPRRGLRLQEQID